MVWEWVPTHATLENRGGVRVFCHRTEVEHPVVLPTSCVQKPLRVFTFVPVETFHAGRRVAHNDQSIRDVNEIFDDANAIEVSSGFRVQSCFGDAVNLVRGSPSSRSNFSSLNLALSPETSCLTKSVIVREELQLVMSLTSEQGGEADGQSITTGSIRSCACGSRESSTAVRRTLSESDNHLSG